MKRVLLIDDSVTIHRVIDICLDKEKFITEKTFSADDAVAKLKANPADIVLLDNKLEGINLPEFTAKIRSLSPSSWIILLTGAFDTFSGANLQASGADDYIFKPFDSNAIEQKILYGIEHAGSSVLPAVPVEAANEEDTEIIIPETDETEAPAEIIDLRAEAPAAVEEERPFIEDELAEDEERQPEEAVTEEEKEEIKNLFTEDGNDEEITDLKDEDLDSLLKELHEEHTEKYTETEEEISPAILELKSMTADTDGEPDITDLIPVSAEEIDELIKITSDNELEKADIQPLEGEIGYDEDDKISEAIEEVPLDGEFEDLTQIGEEEFAVEEGFELPDAEIRIVRGNDEAGEELKSIDDIDFSSLTAVSAEELVEELSAAEGEETGVEAETEPEADELNFADLAEIGLDEFNEEIEEEPKAEEIAEEEVPEVEEIEAEEIIKEAAEPETEEEINLDEFTEEVQAEEALKAEESEEIAETAEEEIVIEEEPLPVEEEIIELEEEQPETEIEPEIEPETEVETEPEIELEFEEEAVQIPAEAVVPEIAEEIAAEPAPAPVAAAPVVEAFSRDELKAAVSTAIDADLLKEIIREVLAEKIEAAVKDSLPAIAERIITEEIERLKRGE